MGKYIKTFEEYSMNKIFYRGDHFERDSFDETLYGTYPGVYFTTDKEYAETYGWFITAAYIILNKPFIVTHVNDITDWNFEFDKLKNDGYDGLSYTDPETGHVIVYTFYPSQVQIVDQYTID